MFEVIQVFQYGDMMDNALQYGTVFCLLDDPNEVHAGSLLSDRVLTLALRTCSRIQCDARSRDVNDPLLIEAFGEM